MHNQDLKIPAEEDVTLSTLRLGRAGGRIVAGVFLGLLFAGKHSLLNPESNLHPESNPKYALKDFVKYALGK